MDRDFNTVIEELEELIPAYVSGDAESEMYHLLDELRALYLAKAEGREKTINECIKTITDVCGGLPNNNLISALEQLKKDNK